MKFKVEREVLTEVVTWTARTLPAHPASPVLAGLRLEAADDTLTISSFDYEVSSTSSIAANVEEPGEVLVSGKLLAEITKALPPKTVTVELEGSKVHVTCGNAKFALMTMPLDTYPELPDFPTSSGMVDSQEFNKAVSQVVVAASADVSLPLYTTVRMEVSGDMITFMSTDRYRLAVRKMQWEPLDTNDDVALLIKARTLLDMAKSLTGGAKLDIALPREGDDNQPGSSILAVGADGRHMTSQLSDGDYPPVARLFPETTDFSVLVDRQALISAVKRVKLVIQKMAAVRLTFADGTVHLEGGEGEDATANEELQCIYSGEEITTAFNPDYLLDGLNALDTNYVRFSFTHPAKPSLMTGQDDPQGEDDTDFRYLLMPIRL